MIVDVKYLNHPRKGTARSGAHSRVPGAVRAQRSETRVPSVATLTCEGWEAKLDDRVLANKSNKETTNASESPREREREREKETARSRLLIVGAERREREFRVKKEE